MIILRMAGGLGNQMFQYALYLKLIHLGKDVLIDDSTCYKEFAMRTTRDVQLEIFNTQYRKATDTEIEEITNNSFLKRLKKKIWKRPLIHREAGASIYDRKVFQIDNTYLAGYFQNHEYFKDIKDIILAQYTFPIEKLPQKSAKYLAQIDTTQSVSIHIRRGDYLKSENTKLFGNICTEEYYRQAIASMKEKHGNCIFYVFTNDQDWAKEHMKEDHFIIVEGNSEDDGYWDMFLMSRCKHNIIANSSFSWWGSWLNTNPDKTIIAPNKWINGQNMQGIYTDNMTIGKS